MPDVVLRAGGDTGHDGVEVDVLDLEVEAEVVGDGLGELEVEALILAVFHVLDGSYSADVPDGQLAVGNKGVALIGRGVGGGGTRCRGARSATTG